MRCQTTAKTTNNIQQRNRVSRWYISCSKYNTKKYYTVCTIKRSPKSSGNKGQQQLTNKKEQEEQQHLIHPLHPLYTETNNNVDVI